MTALQRASRRPSPASQSDQQSQGLTGLGNGWLADIAEKVGGVVHDAVEDVKDTAVDLWHRLLGGHEDPGSANDAEQKPAVDAPPQEQPQVQVPQPDPLKDLMAKDRLTAEEIARARELIATKPTDERKALMLELQGKVIYRNQRNNEDSEEGPSGGTCNVTSLAMALEMQGVINPYPDMQFEDALARLADEQGYGALTSADTWKKLAAHFGHGTIDIGGGTYDRAWWENTMRDGYLAEGNGVVVSVHGHIVRIQGVTDEGVVIDDPYGATVLKGGTKRGWDGFNGKTADGTDASNVGENHIWPWDAVEGFSFKYMRVYQ
ncbi:MAG TPA: C39 family peptidase [Myxococcota bacterium]|nr:C39 family peptidase [Myxococcota bacterium]